MARLVRVNKDKYDYVRQANDTGYRRGVLDTFVKYEEEIEDLKSQIEELKSRSIVHSIDMAREGSERTVVSSFNVGELVNGFVAPDPAQPPCRFIVPDRFIAPESGTYEINGRVTVLDRGEEVAIGNLINFTVEDRVSRQIADMTDALRRSHNNFFGGPAQRNIEAFKGVCTATGTIRKKKHPEPPYYRMFDKRNVNY